MNHWLVKSEPCKYAWTTFEVDGGTHWDGVRNLQARNNLSAMRKNDLVLFYHSNEGKEVVGVARVTREAYPDPSSQDPQWVAVDLTPYYKLEKPVGLTQIKADVRLQRIALLRQSRLSVMPLSREEFDTVLELGTSSAK